MIMKDSRLLNFMSNIFPKRQKSETKLEFSRLESGCTKRIYTFRLTGKRLIVFTLHDPEQVSQEIIRHSFVTTVDSYHHQGKLEMHALGNLYCSHTTVTIHTGHNLLPWCIFFMWFKDTIWSLGSSGCCGCSCCVFGFLFMIVFLCFCRWVYTLKNDSC